MFKNIINEQVNEHINRFYKPQNQALGALRELSEAEGVPIILRDSEMLMEGLLSAAKPKRLLEIGTAVGYSASFMAALLPELSITTIERSDDMYAQAVKNVSELGYAERITVLHGDAAELLAGMARGEGTACGCAPVFDAVFIDAAKSHYREFFDLSVKLCRSGSMVICDNMLFQARVVSDEYDPNGKYKTNVRRLREFWDYLYSLENVQTSFLPVGDGVSISILG